MVLTCSASAMLFLASPVPEVFGINTCVGKWGLLYVRAVSGITVITGGILIRPVITDHKGRADATLQIALCIPAKVYKINITSSAFHHIRLLTQHVGYHLGIPLLI